jgi:carbon starvation protein
MKTVAQGILWTVISGLGAVAYAALAVRRGEETSSAYLVIAALCTYAVAYRFYSKWIAARVLMLDDRRATPCEAREDGRDFVRTNPWIVFGHHFAAISGPGPLVGPVLAAQFGYLPSALWILIGVTLGGAVQDFVILFASMRRNGKSLGQMMREELNGFAGLFSLVAILAIIVILLAVLALIVVTTLAESPWGVFTVGSTIPIALLMGCWLRLRGASGAAAASAVGVILLLAAVWGGQWAHTTPAVAALLSMSQEKLAVLLMAYGLAASVLPVWLLLTPRDYLSTFMKLGTILALAGGVLLTLPVMKMPAVTHFIDGSGPVVPGKLFPFCFITIACGAISGFHSLISSGTTPKLITRERYARPIGYGAMCLESLVAVMALVAACSLEPGTYLAINIKGAGPDAASVAADTVAKVKAAGFSADPAAMSKLAADMGERTLYGKTGGAATLAVGMAGIFGGITHGRWVDLWYHFAIMFEALFILTTLDAGTRVGRYVLQDLLGRIWEPLGRTRNLSANLLASALMVGAWGIVLWSGVKNPDGGAKALWPIFGIANQLLAAIALCLATTILIKTGLARKKANGRGGPAIAWLTLAPLIWLVAVTGTAGWQKLFDPSPKIGFAALEKVQSDKLAKAEAVLAMNPADPQALASAKASTLALFNARFDFTITAVFLVFVAILLIVSVWEWIRLLTGARLADLMEHPPEWLDERAATGLRGGAALGVIAVVFALMRHWCGESDMVRAETAAVGTRPDGPRLLIDVAAVRDAERLAPGDAYVAAAERKSGGPRCC